MFLGARKRLRALPKRQPGNIRPQCVVAQGKVAADGLMAGMTFDMFVYSRGGKRLD